MADSAALERVLQGCIGSRTPGLQVVIVTPDLTLLDWSGGCADIRQQRPMTEATALMAYSMTKTLTAVATLQLVERGQLCLTDKVNDHLPGSIPFHATVTIQQLLNHTSGLPNPVPLRWVHRVESAATFDEDQALIQVLHRYAHRSAAPGARYRYSNIGYWLLGKVIEQVSGQTFAQYMTRNVLRPLQLSPDEIGCSILDCADRAAGYVRRFSWFRILGRMLTDGDLWGGPEGAWVRLHAHHADGPAFGGLVGTARAFSRFLQDQLGDRSELLGPEMRGQMQLPQSTAGGRMIPMTLAWHCREARGDFLLFKEGAGGGFHCEMRLYPGRKLAAVAMANCTEFNPRRLLDELCAAI